MPDDSLTTIIYNKLVRDKIPERIASEGKRVVFTLVRGEEELEAMRRKIVEEANELASAGTQGEIICEIADLLEIIRVYRLRNGITDVQIAEEVNRKKNRNGSFEGGKFLLSVSNSSLVDTVRRNL